MDRTRDRLLLASVVLLALGTDARAFTQEMSSEGEGLHWTAPTITYSVNERGSDDLAPEEAVLGVRRAFATWASVGCLPMVLAYGGTTADSEVGFGGGKAGSDVLVVWRETSAEWNKQAGIIALTAITYDAATGVVYDADIEVNGVDFRYSNEGATNTMDIENTLVHEVGHVIGLDHSDDVHATMYGRSSRGETSKRTLADDDVDGVCTIYDGAPDTGCAMGPGGARTGGAAGLLLLGLLAWLGRRRTPAAGLVALVVVATALPATAYVPYRTDGGLPVHWFTTEIPYVLDAAGAENLSLTVTEEEIAASFAAWADIECAELTFPYEGTREGLAAGFDQNGPNDNAILFVRSGWSDLGPGYTRSIIALTTLIFSDRTGELVDTDLEMNDEYFTFSASLEPRLIETDLRNTVTHEIGHMLGLDHTSVRSATMEGHAQPGETAKRTLEEDDIEGVCALYAEVDPPPVEARDVAGGGDVGSGDGDLPEIGDDDAAGCAHGRGSASGLALLALLAGGVVTLRRLRRVQSLD